jgi:hypothetical protein
MVHEDIYPKLLRDVRFICHKVKSGPALRVSSIGTPILFVSRLLRVIALDSICYGIGRESQYTHSKSQCHDVYH